MEYICKVTLPNRFNSYPLFFSFNHSLIFLFFMYLIVSFIYWFPFYIYESTASIVTQHEVGALISALLSMIPTKLTQKNCWKFLPSLQDSNTEKNKLCQSNILPLKDNEVQTGVYQLSRRKCSAKQCFDCSRESQLWPYFCTSDYSCNCFSKICLNKLPEVLHDNRKVLVMSHNTAKCLN